VPGFGFKEMGSLHLESNVKINLKGSGSNGSGQVRVLGSGEKGRLAFGVV
jgi:hypothetical protein